MMMKMKRGEIPPLEESDDEGVLECPLEEEEDEEEDEFPDVEMIKEMKMRMIVETKAVVWTGGSVQWKMRLSLKGKR
eukprot:12409435-Karenia_brevis.AAC.1